MARHKSKLLIVVALMCFVGGFCATLAFDYYENLRLDRESVHLRDDLSIPYGQIASARDFIAQLDGELLDNPAVATDQLGPVEVTFTYLNLRHRQRSYTFTVDVKDVTAPRIYGSNAYTLARGYGGELTDLMMSGDDLDDSPRREIAGNYDLDKVGAYQLEYIITDASGNRTAQPFTLNIIEPDPDASEDSDFTPDPLPINEVIKDHKTARTKIGIDVSQWQGEIDWSKVKKSGVEFAFIRIGYQVGYGGEYVLDPYFKANLSGAQQNNLPVGVYMYTYADSVAEAQAQANWIKDQLHGAKLELGVAFDWENWHDFNNAGMSFKTINQVANTFLDTLAESGYVGLIYSSKVYLERIWEPDRYPVWLAQYYDRVTYDGDYYIWQMSNSGRVPGIAGDVDLNIMYLDSSP